MSDTGWKGPGTVVNDDSVSGKSWQNPDNAKIEDGNTSYIIEPAYTQYLKATNFGFSVPSGATIDGIEVGVKRKSSSADYWILDYSVKLVKSDGGFSVANRANTDPGQWSTTLTYAFYGGSSDLWGESWTSSDINNSNFGIAFSVDGCDDPSLEVDHIQIKVYYTESSGTEANSERGLYLQGYSTGNSQRGLYTQGYLTNSSERGLYIEGFISDLYSRESASDLESDDTALATSFSEQDYTDVESDDNVYVDLNGTARYMKFLFKEYNENESSEQKFTITWRGKSSLAPSSATVYLQVYNRTSGQWETLDSDSSSPANVKFTLEGSKATNLSNYYDEHYVISVRVYQDVVV